METRIDKLAEDVVQLLKMSKLTLTTAESCTGGLLSAAITGVAGSSAVFGLGRCVYANRFKVSELGVKAETLEKYGAVSAETASEMAIGALKTSGADISAAITGIAGPEGGSAEKPTGTVFIAAAFKDKAVVSHFRITPDYNTLKDISARKYIRYESTRQALVLLRDTLNYILD